MSGSAIDQIDDTVPHSPMAYTSDIRSNTTFIKAALRDHDERIEALGGGSTPLDFLPLTGGTVTGPIALPIGSALAPALQIGSAQNGFFMTGGNLTMRVSGQVASIWNAQGLVHIGPWDAGNQRLVNVSNPLNGSDALNRDAADARYAPVAAWREIARLEAKLKALERQMVILLESKSRLEIGRGMRTDLIK
jgi:hypothetical protein